MKRKLKSAAGPKRVGFGFRRFAHYRLRVLLYAGRPNWDLLNTTDPAQIR
ncbi:MAG: hypothetical protein ACR2H3_05720 [Acidimicrobiales bacterium]